MSNLLKNAQLLNGANIPTSDEKAALDGANTPSALNPYATMSDIPADELTADELAAIQGANTPSASNVFATMDDIVAVTTGDLTEATSSVLTITGGTDAVVGSGTTVQVKQAGAAESGYLSSTDWNTFNDKATDSAVFHKATAAEISAETQKLAPVGADVLLIEDSEAAFAKKYVTLASVWNVGALPNCDDGSIGA